MAVCVAPELDRPTVMNDLVRLVDGAEKREVHNDHQHEGRTGDAAEPEGQRVGGEAPLMSAIRQRRMGMFWADIIIGGIAAILFFVTPFQRDWIESIPDLIQTSTGGWSNGLLL